MLELAAGATVVAHGIHYAVLGIGVVGLMVLLGPHLVGSRRTVTDEHSLRVLALTEHIASGGLGVRMASGQPATRTHHEVVDHIGSLFLPLAVVSSAAAAGVHAVVGPAHFRESTLFGVFFAAAALAQMAWSVAMVIRPTRTLLTAAAVGNSAVLMLWLVTRTIGLPGLLPQPEEVGPWDLTCGIWELVVVIAAVQILRAGPGAPLRLPAWPYWATTSRAWTLGSALVLPALALFAGRT